MSLSPYGLLELSLWGYALVTFLTIQTMFLGVTLYLHRDQSHGGLILHRALRHVFRFWLWFSSGAVTRQWVAVHRRHHALADQQGDPHSPVVFGLRRVVFEGYELYKDAARDPETLRNYGRGTPEDWIERHLYSAHPFLGLVVFSAVPLPHFERRRRDLDADTVNALFVNRMHVLRDYARRVVLPVCRELARREGRGVPVIAPKLLIRHPALLAEEARRKLRELLERYEALRRVVEFRDGLQQLWNGAGANQARAVAQLREWCRRAEASGIRALREFARALPAYAR